MQYSGRDCSLYEQACSCFPHVVHTGERVGAAVVPSPCTTRVPGSIPVHDGALCAFGYSRSILALAGFLRVLRFPPAFKIGD